ncbi:MULTISPECIES: hypothetical protein [unclassified Streptomyces]|uniref:hypothetical protein n=1 Tax=unclassified Streptomyces TaxID=2593676 RepID=UPI0003611F9E|nr:MULTISPECIES: hypothetical protein [unclassified Streptomyces]
MNDDGISWLGERWPHDDKDPLLGTQAGLVFAEGIAPQDLAVIFGAVPWELPERVGDEAKEVYDRTHPRTRVPDDPDVTAYGKEGDWSFLAGKFDFLLHFRPGFAFPPGTGRVVLLYNIHARGMYCMVYFEDGRRVWQDEIQGRVDPESALAGGGVLDHAPEMSFLAPAMEEAGCRPEIRYVDGDPVVVDEGFIPDWRARLLRGLEIAFGMSVDRETFDAGGYPLAEVYTT